MDFISYELYNGRRIKLSTLVGNFTSESLAIEVADCRGGQGVGKVLMEVTLWGKV